MYKAQIRELTNKSTVNGEIPVTSDCGSQAMCFLMTVALRTGWLECLMYSFPDTEATYI